MRTVLRREYCGAEAEPTHAPPPGDVAFRWMPQRTCIFCPAPATEQEHVIPRWMPRFLELEGELMSHDTAIGLPRARHVRIDEYKARIVCGRCHDTITETIENPASRLLKELMTGAARLLSPDEQSLVAAWGAKTAATSWGRTQKRYGVPIAHRRYLIKHAEAHPNVFVGLTRCDGTHARVVHGRTEITPADGLRRFHVYHFALAFGSIGVVVYGPGDGRRRLAYKDMTSLLVRVSPPTRKPRRWPPGRILGWDDFSALRDLDFRAGR